MIEHPGSQEGKSNVRDDYDARLALIYQEAVRGLSHQQSVVESINLRAGNLIFAMAFASSLLGGRALADGLATWDWIALALLFAIGALTVFILWPYYGYTFRFDPEQLLTEFGSDKGSVTIHTMRRTLSMRIKQDLTDNWRIIQRLRLALQLALVLLVLNILAWLLAVASP